MYTAKYPAAFINVIAESGSKAEAVEHLQRTWDDYMRLREALEKISTGWTSQPEAYVDLATKALANRQ